MFSDCFVIKGIIILNQVLCLTAYMYLYTLGKKVKHHVRFHKDVF